MDAVDRNDLGQPVGPAVSGFVPPPAPPATPMDGVHVRLEPLDAAVHAADLHAANKQDSRGAMWTYMSYGPFADLTTYAAWVESVAGHDDPQFHAVIDLISGKAVGVASYLRAAPEEGSIEVGHIAYSPLLQRTTGATEAMYLMMQRVFDLGYRRYEWKCDALNEASRRAAVRLGFTFEGVFRQAMVYKGRNRDTAWYSVVDHEWPALRTAYERWLASDNFDESGQQRSRLRPD